MPLLPEPSDEAVRSAITRLIGSRAFTFTRASSGVSTPVYRVRQQGGEVVYFRVAEGPESDLGPEVRVHDTLRERGCLVPPVLEYSPMDADIGRSVAILEEIEGEPVYQVPNFEQLAGVLTAAGRDLAIINSIPVDGFGWIRRDQDAVHLSAENSSYPDWVLSDSEDGMEACLEALADHLTRDESQAVRDIAMSMAEARGVPSMLAHGDFDVTHIFQERGRYTGLIDFGEIRGSEPWYDLSVFWRLHSGYDAGRFMYEALSSGYRDVGVMPDESEIQSTALLIALRFAARRTIRQGHDWLRANPHEGGVTRVRDLAAALTPRHAGRGEPEPRSHFFPSLGGVQAWGRVASR